MQKIKARKSLVKIGPGSAEPQPQDIAAQKRESRTARTLRLLARLRGKQPKRN